MFIENAVLEFGPGLNIIIGESGVGKSLLVNILSIPLGFQPGPDVIGKAADKAQIELYLSDPKHPRADIKLFIDIADKITFKVNNEIMSQKKVKAMFPELLDVHSQNNFDLLRGNQLTILEKFMDEKELAALKEYRLLYADYQQQNEQLKKYRGSIISDSDLDFYKFKIEEIKKINPRVNEDNELFEQLKFHKNALELSERFNKIKENLEDSYSLLKKALHEVGTVQAAAPEMQAFSQKLNEHLQQAEDFSWQLAKIEKKFQDIDEQSILQIETRLEELENIKRKYSRDLSGIIGYYKELEEKLVNQDEYKALFLKAQKQTDELEKNLKSKAGALTEKRKAVAERVMALIKTHLQQLKLDKTELSASFIAKEGFDEHGADVFEFLIRVNVGSHFYALNKLSGGETSRVMLALKAALLKASPISTYIFDEIDSGVSGDIAFKMGEVLKNMSAQRQLIVITHLPMIAVKGDRIFKINKTYTSKKTIIQVDNIDTPERLLQSLSLLLTENPTEHSKAFIQSLLKQKK